VPAELKKVLEALIFVHRGPLDRRTMEAVLKDDWSPGEIAAALEELKGDVARRGGVIRLEEIAGGFEFATSEEVGEWIRRMDHHEHHRHLSRPALETLAIVAYRQPVTRQEIEQIRGVNVERILRGLLEKKLIKILGRKDLPGKPIVYGTTADFLRYFGLDSLASLPSLKEFAEEHAPEVEEAAILPLEGDEEQGPEEAGKGSGEEEGVGDPPEGTEPGGPVGGSG